MDLQEEFSKIKDKFSDDRKDIRQRFNAQIKWYAFVSIFHRVAEVLKCDNQQRDKINYDFAQILLSKYGNDGRGFPVKVSNKLFEKAVKEASSIDCIDPNNVKW